MYFLIFVVFRDVSFVLNVIIYFGSWVDLYIYVVDR